MSEPTDTLSLEDGLRGIDAVFAEKQKRIDAWLETTTRVPGGAVQADKYPIWMILRPGAESLPADFVKMDFPLDLRDQLAGGSGEQGGDGIEFGRQVILAWRAVDLAEEPMVLPWYAAEKAKEIAVQRWAEMCQARDLPPGPGLP